MKIGELARRTDISTRMLRYYEEQGLLTAERDDNGYRSYAESSAGQALQIRGLLDSGLTTEIIRDLLPCLAGRPDACRRPVDPAVPVGGAGRRADPAPGADPEADRLPDPQPGRRARLHRGGQAPAQRHLS